MPPECAYCGIADLENPSPAGGWIHRDDDWLVQHGPPETTMAGGVKIVSRRHFTDFAEMTTSEAASFGLLLRGLDTAIRSVTDAERVHLVSTRDRVPHFHAWLYPRMATEPRRGTDFLAAPQQCLPADAERVAEALRGEVEI